MVDTVQNKGYMEVNKYGITLTRLKTDDLELVRNWRNDPKIVKYMHFKEHITPEMQQKWFFSINNSNNYYFIIVVDGLKIGLANLKDIDYESKKMEAGIFIYNENHLNALVSYKVAFAQYDFGFFNLNIETCFGHVLRSNTNAIEFNESLGYALLEGQNEEDYQLYKITKEQYLFNRDQLLMKLRKYIVI
jgi:UDP-4-amino-4,6-dideoxy-N-acetyl-beta-L-altrosamine N-acetyltransferase